MCGNIDGGLLCVSQVNKVHVADCDPRKGKKGVIGVGTEDTQTCR
jgi:hypothetical protein